MKKLFTAIKRGDANTVCMLLDKKPDLIKCTAVKPPKQDDGQSPLQVAIRSQMLDIAGILLDRGADVNFMESESCCNNWRMPAFHDAVTLSIMFSRWNLIRPNGEIEIHSTAAKADAAFALLKRMLDHGADIHACDSYGNSCLDRAVLDARRVLPGFHFGTKEVLKDRALTEELISDLSRIFTLLSSKGAVAHAVNIDELEPVYIFLHR